MCRTDADCPATGSTTLRSTCYEHLCYYSPGGKFQDYIRTETKFRFIFLKPATRIRIWHFISIILNRKTKSWAATVFRWNGRTELKKKRNYFGQHALRSIQKLLWVAFRKKVSNSKCSAWFCVEMQINKWGFRHCTSLFVRRKEALWPNCLQSSSLNPSMCRLEATSSLWLKPYPSNSDVKLSLLNRTAQPFQTPHPRTHILAA